MRGKEESMTNINKEKSKKEEEKKITKRRKKTYSLKQGKKFIRSIENKI